MRSELFHPLVSHFPIVLLSLYPVAAVTNLFITEKYKESVQFTSRVFIYLGLLTHFISMYLGDVALEQISAKVCKLQLVYEHEHLAKMVLLFYLIVVAFDVLDISKKLDRPKPLAIAKVVISFVGLWYVIQTGHSGAELVYDYGTAVEVPASCKMN